MLVRELGLCLVQTKLLAGGLEPSADHPGDRAGSGHPLGPTGLVILASLYVAYQLEYMAMPVGEVGDQPFAEEVAHLEWQAQGYVAGATDANRRRSIENALDLGVVDGRYDGCDHHRGRHAGF